MVSREGASKIIVDVRFLVDTVRMTGNELMRSLRKYAKRHGLELKRVTHRGKGSHATLYLGSRFTIIKDARKEIGAGLLAKMLRDLGVDRRELL